MLRGFAVQGFRVAVCNRSPDKVDATVARAAAEGGLPLEGFKDPAAFVASIKKPRRVVLLVMAGKPVDETIALLAQHLEPGDVLVRYVPCARAIQRGPPLQKI
jgi:6-phosphogluconate dehydrogenase